MAELGWEQRYEKLEEENSAMPRCINTLEAAIRNHRRNVWGEGAVEHDEDGTLYAVLRGEEEE